MASASSRQPPLLLLSAVALVSAAVLGLEVALTRVFAALLSYHFTFLIVSIALCGLGLGSYAMHWLRRSRGDTIPETLSLPLLPLLFAVTIIGALFLTLRGVFAYWPELYGLAALIMLVPFAVAGAFLAEVFARFTEWSGRLYAWDLAGAAIAACGVVGLLGLMSSIDACLAIAVLASGAGVCLLSLADIAKVPHRIITVAPLLLATFLIANIKLRWLDIPPLPAHAGAVPNIRRLFTQLGTPGDTARIVETRWNAFARIDVVDQGARMPGALFIYTNGDGPTNMMRWDGDLSSLPHMAAPPLSDWAFEVAPLGSQKGKRSGHVLSIGPGGGLDALLALRHGAARFDGAEINPSIRGLMHDYREYNGGIYDRPDVHVVTAEGRAFVREAVAKKRRYSMIYSALTKTATAQQGTALLESFIYTEEAFRDYLNALESDGQVTFALNSAGLIARCFTTAIAALGAEGAAGAIDERAACRHLAVMYDPRPTPYSFALVIQKSPFTSVQTLELLESARRKGLIPIWIPGRAISKDFGPYAEVATGALSLDDFIGAFRDDEPSIDVSPCSDDRPFALDLNPRVLPVFKQLAVLALLLALGLIVLDWRAEKNRPQPGPNKSQRGSAPTHAFLPTPADMLFVFYFLTLGMGFMLVEIPLTQKLVLPLGYPTLSLTVILFSLLLGGGAGAWFSQRFMKSALTNWATACALGVAIVTAFGIYPLDWAQTVLLALSLPVRCMVTALLLLPLGFLLGTPFPSGLRLLARTNQVPLIWGLNGVASVVGSLCAAMGAKLWGFNSMLTAGAVMYLGAALLLTLAGRLGSTSQTDDGSTIPNKLDDAQA